MNMKDNLIFFLSIFPVFIVRSNLNIIEIFFILSAVIILTVINYFVTKYLNQKEHLISKYIYTSFILTYGLDNHLGLFNGVIQPNVGIFLKYFSVIYIPALFILIILVSIFFFIQKKTTYQKTSTIFIITMLSLFIFNIFDNTKSNNKIPYFKKETIGKSKKTTLIMIWDEMSGMNSLSSETNDGREFNKVLTNFYNKFNFEYYPNTFSNSDNSVSSISSLINFHKKIDQKSRNQFASESNNYFVEYYIKKNKLFEKFHSVSVIQNLHLNYCRSKNVNKCYQYDPYNLDKINAKIDSFSKIISLWSLNGSIVGKFFWRSLKQLELTTSILEPEGEKLFIKNILNLVHKDILSEEYDLIFMHVLVPHKPYGLNKNCDFETKISNLNIFFDKNKHFNQHNIERKCVVKFMDEFLSKLENLDKIKIFIISDHGSRITNSDKSSLSSIFAFKNFGNNSAKRIENKVITQEIFKLKIDE